MNKKYNTNFVTISIDTKFKYDRMISDFLKKYPLNKIDDIKSEKLNNKNLEIIRCINEYNDKFYYFNRIIRIISNYFKSMIDDDASKYGYKKIFDIWNSVKSQQFVIGYHSKKVIKKIALTADLYKAFKYSIGSCINRFDYLLDNVIIEYINITPLYDYKNILEEKGSSLYEDILEFFPIDITIEKDDPLIQSYIELVNVKTLNREEWKDNFNKYKEKYDEDISFRNKYKAEQKVEAKRNNAENVQIILNNSANMLYHNFELAFQYSCYDNRAYVSLVKVKERALEFKEQNKCNDAKILLLAKVFTGSKGITKYYNADSYELMSNSIKNATIMKVDDPIPDEIQKLVDEFKMVYFEFII